MPPTRRAAGQLLQQHACKPAQVARRLSRCTLLAANRTHVLPEQGELAAEVNKRLWTGEGARIHALADGKEVHGAAARGARAAEALIHRHAKVRVAWVLPERRENLGHDLVARVPRPRAQHRWRMRISRHRRLGRGRHLGRRLAGGRGSTVRLGHFLGSAAGKWVQLGAPRAQQTPTARRRADATRLGWRAGTRVIRAPGGRAELKRAAAQSPVGCR